MDCNTIISVASVLITLLGVYFAVWIYYKSNRTTLLHKVYDLIQSDNCINNRKYVFDNLYDNIVYHNYIAQGIPEENIIKELKLSQEKLNMLKKSDKRKIENWDNVDFKYAEEICRSFDLAGIILKDDIKGRNYFVNIWSDAIKKSFSACKPLIDYKREMQKNPSFWHTFEEMNNIAIKKMNT